MDEKFFRKRVSASWQQNTPATVVNQEARREINATKTIPAPDTRQPAFGNTIEDGRQFTDQRDKCVTRAPPGTQFAVKQWNVHQAEKIMDISRQRQADMVGQVQGTAPTEIPPALQQKCTAFGCDFENGVKGGIGIERKEPVPELFGTFAPRPGPDAIPYSEKTGLNDTILYGRNTPSRWMSLQQ